MNKYLAFVACITLTVSSCGKPSEIAKYERAYSIAQGLVRDRMKSPSSTRFPAFREEGRITNDSGLVTYSTDSVTIHTAGKMIIVQGRYESQNGFGVYLPGAFTVSLLDEGDTIKPATGDPDSDVKLSK